MILQFVYYNKIKLEARVYTDDYKLIHQRLLSRYKESDARWLMAVKGCTVDEANRALNDFCEDEIRDPIEDMCDPPSKMVDEWIKPVETEQPQEIPKFVIHVREMLSLKQHAASFHSVDPCEALQRAWDETPNTSIEPTIEWGNQDQLCCLDVDYHNTHAKTVEELERLVLSIKPLPFAWHPSHGNESGYGAKLYYSSHPGFTALELASVAGVAWITQDPTAQFDLVKQSRHPCFKRSRDERNPPLKSTKEIRYVCGSGDVSSLRRVLLSEVDYTDVENYLASKGWIVGQTLPHTECPINPTGSDRKSVYVGDKGIYCHSCYADGLGGRTPGLRTYASLIGGEDNRIKTMVKNFVHLEHASIVLQNMYPTLSVDLLNNVYRVLMKMLHSHEDPRINMAMNAGKGFIRIRGQWVSSDGTATLKEGLQPYVKSLPAVIIPTEDGPALNTPVYTAFLNTGDLSEFGYYDVSFIRGCRVYGVFLEYPKKEVVKVMPRKEFVDNPPRYLPQSTRMPAEDSWRLLSEMFPGINQRYVKLLIAAKGASEGRLAQCPFLMVTGVSSAGKSTTAHVAAGICGDKADEPIFHPDPMRFRAALMDGARESGFICVNEVFKMSDRFKLDPVQALDPMLSLTEDSRSHVLYVGTVPFGRLPVFVLTDINCPPEVLQDYQLARRFTFIRLDSSIEWTNSLVSQNIRPHEFRLISPEHNRAADSILSDIIDEFFQEPLPLSEIAKRLGLGTADVRVGDARERTEQKVSNVGSSTESTEEPIDESYELDERQELKERLRQFYATVIAAPPLTAGDAKRFSGKGWKKVDRSTRDAIVEQWNELCDGQDGDKWGSSRIVSAEDWHKLLKLDPTIPPVVVDIYRYRGGRIVYVRFRSNDSSRKPIWVDGQYRD